MISKLSYTIYQCRRCNNPPKLTITRNITRSGYWWCSDQGIMIGYGCNENDQYLPQEYFLSRELNKFIYGKFPYDGKTQVTMNGNSLRVVCSFQNTHK